MTVGEKASVESVLGALTKARMVELGRRGGVALRSGNKESIAKALATSGRLSFRHLLEQMHRDELRLACREHGLEDSGRARQALMARLLEAHGGVDSVPPQSLFSASLSRDHRPKVNDTVIARHRQWLVDAVTPPPSEGHATVVSLTCLDDDHRGETTTLFWELELGARVINPAADAFADVGDFDDPGTFLAYLSAIRWQGVTATRADRFQAPFRAGIHIQAHQLTPLQKALSLPRANLFIADDVGLGKTIEAGLVLQELILRQRVHFALVVCPASVTLQWQAEMEGRFGLRFEIYSRDFVVARQRERGFGINPWSTHNRFIVSYPLLRDPAYRDPLLDHLRTLTPDGSGDRARRSMLILDEAHTAAPASASRYAVDSKTTTVVRDIAPRFENRLFLSATPHNGHSNSFSALLEILDPQRFTRGVEVSGPDALDPVMVRRLKRDLHGQGGALTFPERKVIRLSLEASDATAERPVWSRTATVTGSDGAETTGAPGGVGETGTNELRMAELLAQYTALATDGGKGRHLTFVNLQKRLLSSPEAFHRTLERHVHGLEKGTRAFDVAAYENAAIDGEADPTEDAADAGAERTFGIDEDILDAAEDAAIEADAQTITAPASAKEVLDELRTLARASRREPDAKLLAFVEWLREHACPGISLDPAAPAPKGKAAAWGPRRVIVFTEYTDTRRYLRHLLQSALEGTDDADGRIVEIHGGMGEEAREEVQFRFNADPAQEPARILLATDAAREGLNLQAHCADLFHWDIPWNPSRMEQRNGRIDRALQPMDEVRCHYFAYAQRREDRVLEALVRKSEIIRQELGSMGDVISHGIESALRRGITDASLEDIEGGSEMAAGETNDRTATTARELEALRTEQRIKRDLASALKVYNASQAIVGFHPEQLRHTVDVALRRVCGEALAPTDVKAGPKAFTIPELPADWGRTLDGLRPPRRRDEPFYEWRKRAPRPVVFEPPKTMTSEVVQLHLEHPFVKRLLSPFTAQGFAEHDLAGVTILPARGIDKPHALAIGRLCLFGAGAGRLHDELLYLSAPVEDGALGATSKDEKLIATLEAHLRSPHEAQGAPASLVADLRAVLPAAAKALWTALRDEADAATVAAEGLLVERGRTEADQLRAILSAQRVAIEKKLPGLSQLRLDLGDGPTTVAQARQLDRDLRHLNRRLENLDRELAEEPAQIAALYEKKLRRFEPVGLLFFVPELSL